MLDDGLPTPTSNEQHALEVRVAEDCLVELTPKSATTLQLNTDDHINYILKGLRSLPAGFVALDASRPWLCFWALHSLALMDALPNDATTPGPSDIVQFLQQCQHPGGGFGGGPQQLPHLATTYAAVASLVTLGGDLALAAVDRVKLQSFLRSCCIPPAEGGGMVMHQGGEVDVRGCYTALAAAHMTGLDKQDLAARAGVVDFIRRCQTYEGGLGGEPDNEAHGGYTFCGLAALMLLGQAEVLDIPRLLHWLVHKQGVVEGGFAGRTNKLVDGCYTYWQGSLLPMIHALGPQYFAQTGPRTGPSGPRPGPMHQSDTADTQEHTRPSATHPGPQPGHAPKTAAQQQTASCHANIDHGNCAGGEPRGGGGGGGGGDVGDESTAARSSSASTQGHFSSRGCGSRDGGNRVVQVAKQLATSMTLRVLPLPASGTLGLAAQAVRAAQRLQAELMVGSCHTFPSDVPPPTSLPMRPDAIHERTQQYRRLLQHSALALTDGRARLVLQQQDPQHAQQAQEADDVAEVVMSDRTSEGEGTDGQAGAAGLERQTSSRGMEGPAGGTAMLDRQGADSGINGQADGAAQHGQADGWQELCNGSAVQLWVLACCQGMRGLRDKPGKSPDYYHTCYCLSGLSAMQHYQGVALGGSANWLRRADLLCNVVDDKLQQALEYYAQQDVQEVA